MSQTGTEGRAGPSRFVTDRHQFGDPLRIGCIGQPSHCYLLNLCTVVVYGFENLFFLCIYLGCLSVPVARELVLDYIIERKRMDDLCGSIIDGRFREQKVL